MKKIRPLIICSVVMVLFLNIGIVSGVLSKASDQEFVLREIGHIPTEGRLDAAHVMGDIVYIIDFLLGFRIYDVSEPANPTLLGSYEGNNYINPAVKGGHTFLVKGGYAIVGFQHAGLKILDISDPTNLELVGEYYGGTDTYHIAVVDDLVYMAMEDDGLQVIDISDVTQPTKVGEFNNGNSLYFIHVIGSIAYTKDDEQDKTLGLDVTDPSTITEIGQFDWTAIVIETVDDIGYICALDEGVLVYDFSDPSIPIFLDEYNDGGAATDIAISGNYAFVADDSDGLEILDITDPENLVEIAQFNDGGTARSVCVEGNVAYVSEYEDGLEILQIEGLNKSADPTTVQVPETTDSLRVELLVLVVLLSLLMLRRGKQQKARKAR